MAIAYLGLGTNLGDRRENLAAAVRILCRRHPLNVIAVSGVLETEPVELPDQPLFLNQIIKIETGLAPLELLAAARETESAMGRTPTVPKGPRVIDIDILLYDDIVMDTEDLVIPHPGIVRREFVMRHLAELDPALTDPVTGKAYRSLIPPS